MADANLLDALRRHSGKIDNILIFGRVRCAIKDPKLLGKSVEVSSKEGCFAIIDAYALNCLDEDYFGERDVRDGNKLYFTRGSMVIFIDSKKWVGKDVKVYKRGSYGVTIKQQYNHKTPNDGITALVFTYSNGGYKLTPNKLVELGKNDSDTRGTLLQDFIISIVANKEGVIEYPVTLNSIVDYEGVSNYEELPKEEITIKESVFDKGTDRIDVTKIDMHLVYHLRGEKPSQYLDAFKEEVENCKTARRKYCDSMLSRMSDLYNGEKSDDFDYSSIGHRGNTPVMGMQDVQMDIKKRFVANIASKYLENIGQSKKKGAYYVSEFLKCASEGSFSGTGEQGVTREAKEAIREAATQLAGMVNFDPTVLLDYQGVPLLRNNLSYATVVIAVMLGLDPEEFATSQAYMKMTYGVDAGLWFYLLIRNPYILGLVSSGFSLVLCDSIYLSFGKFYSKDCLSEDCIKTRETLIFLETLKNFSDKDSLIDISVLKQSNSRSEYPTLGKRYFDNYRFPCKFDNIEAINVLLSKDIRMSSKSIEDWISVRWFSEDRLNELADNGVLEIIDSQVMLAVDMEREFMIYDVLLDKGHTETGVTDENIEEAIEEFEEEKGFKLEALQKDGIKLTKYMAAVLSGCAGSGKTTTSDCMVEALKKLDDFEDDYELVFCAPTGKACRRLAEVVGGTVRTIHSQFGVFMGGSSYMAPVYKRKKSNNDGNEKTYIYLLDEMAMCSMPLLFEICRNIGEDDFIYFLGDCKQLPPIGKGNPFALLMKILPCVELGVSKRAAEGSAVNYNTTLINCMSDGYVRELEYNEKDFFCRECSDAEITREVVACWKAFMNGSMNGTKYEEDDIQVITGYQKEDIVFSVPRLNPSIQRLLRSNDRLLFRHTSREFYNHDRVIHVRLNDYSMPRYVEESGDTFVEVATFGMVNGELGKLVGVVRSDMVNFVKFSKEHCTPKEGYYENVSKGDLEELIKKREARDDTLRDDSKVRNNRMYFIKVRVYDVDLRREVTVLYRATGRPVEGEVVMEGSDLSNLDLAYALTTHKMQGSQSPVVILPFGTSCNPRFINRNMLNTMVTRSQGVVCMIGTVKGADSPVNMGRKYVSSVKCSDLLTILSNS